MPVDIQEQGRRWLRRDLREKARALRVELRAARAAHRDRLRELRDTCKARKLEARERAKLARADQRAQQRAERERLRLALIEARRAVASSCSGSRAELRAAMVEAKRRYEAAKRDARLATPSRTSRRSGMSAAELRAHLEDEARANLASEDERALFDSLAARRRIKATPRLSLTEAFYQYVHDHPAELAEVRHARELERLAELEREERAAWREARRARPRRARASMDAAAYEFGG